MKKAARRHKSSLTKRMSTDKPLEINPFEELPALENVDVASAGVEQVSGEELVSINSAVAAHPLAGSPFFLEPNEDLPGASEMPPYLRES
jgi:hypothetical protein